MIKDFVCINCPLGCQLTINYDGEKILAVAGNACPRGIAYVKQEFICPLRVLTTLIRVKGTDRPIGVRSDKPIPLQKLLICKDYLNHVEAIAPVQCGDILVKNICSTGANIVAASNSESKTLY